MTEFSIYQINVDRDTANVCFMRSRFCEVENEGKEHLSGYIVFSQDSFDKPYDERSRTYGVSSNNKAFQSGMAVSKLWPVTVRLATVLDYASNPEKTTKSKSKYSDADYQALRDVVAYAKDGEKTERELFCEGIHCNPQTAREQFVTVKEQFDKTDGIQAYHGYLSFKETDITPELAQQVGMAFAERMWGDRFQVLVTTHLNTEHLHSSLVPFANKFPKNTKLYKLMTTKPNEKFLQMERVIVISCL